MAHRHQVAAPGEMDFSSIVPHEGQMTVVESVRSYRITVHSPGRRWGKSSVRIMVCTDQVLRSKGWIEGCVGSQSHAEATNLQERDILAYGPLVKDVKNEDQRRYIDLYAMRMGEFCQNEGSRIWYPSLGDDHQMFQGHGLWFAIMDEFSHHGVGSWDETIRPMLADTGGHALIQGTPIPEGKNYTRFHELSEMGTLGTEFYDPTVNYITGPSEQNPFIDHQEVARQRDDLIRRGRAALAANLYDGQFVLDLGAVFGNLDTVFSLRGTVVNIDPYTWMLREPFHDESFVIGIDFGRHDDATVVTAISRQTLEQVGLMKIEKTEYPVQLPLVDRFIRRFPNRQIWSEGREEMAADLLRRQYGDSCMVVKWTAGGKWDKAQAIARLMDYFERGALRMMNIPWQRDEFQKFTRKKLPSGRWDYSAPEGKHDDSVAATAYAAYGLPLLGEYAPKRPAIPSVVSPHVFSRWQTVREEQDMPFVLRRDPDF